MTKLTHKGWFGVCPVYIGGVDTDCPTLEARHRSLEWLLDLSEAVFGTIILVKSITNPAWEPTFPIRITGELPEPIEASR